MYRSNWQDSVFPAFPDANAEWEIIRFSDSGQAKTSVANIQYPYKEEEWLMIKGHSSTGENEAVIIQSADRTSFVVYYINRNTLSNDFSKKVEIKGSKSYNISLPLEAYVTFTKSDIVLSVKLEPMHFMQVFINKATMKYWGHYWIDSIYRTESLIYEIRQEGTSEQYYVIYEIKENSLAIGFAQYQQSFATDYTNTILENLGAPYLQYRWDIQHTDKAGKWGYLNQNIRTLSVLANDQKMLHDYQIDLVEQGQDTYANAKLQIAEIQKYELAQNETFSRSFYSDDAVLVASVHNSFNQQWSLRYFDKNSKQVPSVFLYEVKFDSEPFCDTSPSGSTGETYFLYCITSKWNDLYYMSMSSTKMVKFYKSSVQYSFNGYFQFCDNGNDCIKFNNFDIQCQDQDIYRIYPGREDIYGKKYALTTTFVSSPYQCKAVDNSIQFWISLSNIYSGHEVTYTVDLNKTRKVPDGVNTQSWVDQKHQIFTSSLSFQVSDQSNINFGTITNKYGITRNYLIITGGTSFTGFSVLQEEDKQTGKFSTLSTIETPFQVQYGGFYKDSEGRTFYIVDKYALKDDILSWRAFDLSDPKNIVEVDINYVDQKSEIFNFVAGDYDKFEVIDDYIYKIGKDCIHVYKITGVEFNGNRLQINLDKKTTIKSDTIVSNQDLQLSDPIQPADFVLDKIQLRYIYIYDQNLQQIRTFTTEPSNANTDINWVEQELGDRTYKSTNSLNHRISSTQQFLFVQDKISLYQMGINDRFLDGIQRLLDPKERKCENYNVESDDWFTIQNCKNGTEINELQIFVNLERATSNLQEVISYAGKGSLTYTLFTRLNTLQSWLYVAYDKTVEAIWLNNGQDYSTASSYTILPSDDQTAEWGWVKIQVSDAVKYDDFFIYYIMNAQQTQLNQQQNTAQQALTFYIEMNKISIDISDQEQQAIDKLIQDKITLDEHDLYNITFDGNTILGNNISFYTVEDSKKYTHQGDECQAHQLICIPPRAEIVLTEINEYRNYDAIQNWSDDILIILQNQKEFRFCELSDDYTGNKLCLKEKVYKLNELTKDLDYCSNIATVSYKDSIDIVAFCNKGKQGYLYFLQFSDPFLDASKANLQQQIKEATTDKAEILKVFNKDDRSFDVVITIINDIQVMNSVENYDKYYANSLFIYEFTLWDHSGNLNANQIDQCVVNPNNIDNSYSILDVIYFNSKVAYADSNGQIISTQCINGNFLIKAVWETEPWIFSDNQAYRKNVRQIYVLHQFTSYEDTAKLFTVMDNGDYFILEAKYDLLTYKWNQVFSTYNSPELYTELYSTSSISYDSKTNQVMIPFLLRTSHSLSHKVRIFDLDYNETVTDIYVNEVPYNFDPIFYHKNSWFIKQGEFIYISDFLPSYNAIQIAKIYENSNIYIRAFNSNKRTNQIQLYATNGLANKLLKSFTVDVTWPDLVITQDEHVNIKITTETETLIDLHDLFHFQGYDSVFSGSYVTEDNKPLELPDPTEYVSWDILGKFQTEDLEVVHGMFTVDSSIYILYTNSFRQVILGEFSVYSNEYLGQLFQWKVFEAPGQKIFVEYIQDGSNKLAVVTQFTTLTNVHISIININIKEQNAFEFDHSPVDITNYYKRYSWSFINGNSIWVNLFSKYHQYENTWYWTFYEISINDKSLKHKSVNQRMLQQIKGVYDWSFTKELVYQYYDSQEQKAVECSSDGTITLNEYQFGEKTITNNVLLSNSQPASYGGIQSCYYYEDQSLIAVGTPKGVILYDIDWKALQIKLFSTWFPILYGESNKNFLVKYVNSRAVVFYVTSDFKTWDIRYGSVDQIVNENVLSNIKYYSQENIQCAFGIGTLHYIDMYCMYDDLLYKYQVADQASVQFPSSDQSYLFRGSCQFCIHHTDICAKYDFPADSSDANKLQIYEGRTDYKGRKYGEPRDFWNNKEDAYFLTQSQQMIAFYIPVTNYYSGHNVNYQTTLKSQSSNDVTVYIQDGQKYKKLDNDIPIDAAGWSNVFSVKTVKESGIYNMYYYFYVNQNSKTIQVYKDSQGDGKFNKLLDIASSYTVLSAQILQSESMSNAYYVTYGQDDSNQFHFEVYDLKQLWQQDKAPTKMTLFESFKTTHTQDFNRFLVYDKFVIINEKSQVSVFQFALEADKVTMQEIVPINQTTIKDNYESANEYQFDDISVVGFTSHLSYLLVYEHNARSMFTFDLNQELSGDVINKVEWIAEFAPDENHFTGIIGVNKLSSAEWNYNYVKQFQVIESKSAFLLGIEKAKYNLRQGFVDPNGYSFLYQYLMDCQSCEYLDFIANDQWLIISVRTKSDTTESYSVRIFNLDQQANSNWYTEISLDKQHQILLKSCHDILIEEYTYSKWIGCSEKLYLYAQNSLSAIELNPTKRHLKWYQIPEYVPDRGSFVLWTQVQLLFKNKVPLMEQVDVQLEVRATQVDTQESNSTEINIQVQEFLDPSIYIDDGVKKGTEIFSLNSITLQYSQKVNYEVPIKIVDAIHSQFQLQYDGVFIDPILNCKIYDFNPNIVCLETKFGVAETYKNDDKYQAISRYTNSGYAALKNYNQIEFCNITDEHTQQICEYTQVNLNYHCSLMSEQDNQFTVEGFSTQLYAFICQNQTDLSQYHLLFYTKLDYNLSPYLIQLADLGIKGKIENVKLFPSQTTKSDKDFLVIIVEELYSKNLYTTQSFAYLVNYKIDVQNNKWVVEKTSEVTKISQVELETTQFYVTDIEAHNNVIYYTELNGKIYAQGETVIHYVLIPETETDREGYQDFPTNIIYLSEVNQDTDRLIVTTFFGYVYLFDWNRLDYSSKWTKIFTTTNNPQLPEVWGYPDSAQLSSDGKLLVVPTWTQEQLYNWIFDLSDNYQIYALEPYSNSRIIFYNEHLSDIEYPQMIFAQGTRSHKLLFMFQSWDQAHSADGQLQNIYVVRDENLTLFINTTYANKYTYDVALFSYNKVDQMLLTSFEVKVKIQLIIQQTRPINVNWPIKSNCYLELHDFFNYENLEATVVDYSYVDEYGIQRKLSPPQVRSGYTIQNLKAQYGSYIHDLDKSYILRQLDPVILYENNGNLMLVCVDDLVSFEEVRSLTVSNSIQQSPRLAVDQHTVQSQSNIVVSQIDKLDSKKVTLSLITQDMTKIQNVALTLDASALSDNLYWTGFKYDNKQTWFIAYGQVQKVSFYSGNLEINPISLSLIGSVNYQPLFMEFAIYEDDDVASVFKYGWLGCTKSFVFSLDIQDLSVQFQSTEPLLYGDSIKSCIYDHENQILTLTTEDGVFEYEVTYSEQTLTFALGDKYYEPFNMLAQSNLYSIYKSNEVQVVYHQVTQFDLFIRTYSRTLDWKYNFLVQFKLDPVALPGFRFVFTDNNYDRITVSFASRNNELTTYYIYYKHYMTFADAPKPYFLNATLKFCVVDTDFCKDFPNVLAYYKDYNKFVVFNKHQNLYGLDMQEPEEILTSSKGGQFNQNNVYSVINRIPIEGYFAGHDLDIQAKIKDIVKPSGLIADLVDSYSENSDVGDLSEVLKIGAISKMETLKFSNYNLLAFYVDRFIYIYQFVFVQSQQNYNFKKIKIIDIQNSGDQEAQGLVPEKGVLYELDGLYYYIVSYTGVEKQQIYFFRASDFSFTQIQVQVSGSSKILTGELKTCDNNLLSVADGKISGYAISFENIFTLTSIPDLSQADLTVLDYVCWEINYEELVLAYDKQQKSVRAFSYDSAKWNEVSFVFDQSFKGLDTDYKLTRSIDYLYLLEKSGTKNQIKMTQVSDTVLSYQTYADCNGQFTDIKASTNYIAALCKTSDGSSIITVFKTYELAHQNGYRSYKLSSQELLAFDVSNSDQEDYTALYISTKNQVTQYLLYEQGREVWVNISYPHDVLQGMKDPMSEFVLELKAKQSNQQSGEVSEDQANITIIQKGPLQYRVIVNANSEILKTTYKTLDYYASETYELTYDTFVGENIDVSLQVENSNLKSESFCYNNEFTCLTGSKYDSIYQESNGDFSAYFYLDTEAIVKNQVALLRSDQNIDIINFIYRESENRGYTQKQSYAIEKKNCYDMSVVWDNNRNNSIQNLLIFNCKQDEQNEAVYFYDLNSKTFTDKIENLKFRSQLTKSYIQEAVQDGQQDIYVMELDESNQLKVISLKLDRSTYKLVDEYDVQIYNFITLNYEDFEITSFEYYPQYTLLIIADKTGFVHFCYRNETTQKFEITRSYRFPQSSYYDILTEEERQKYTSYAVTLRPIDKLSQVDRLMMLSWTGDLYKVDFYGNQIHVAPQFTLISESQNSPDKIVEVFYQHKIAYYNNLLAIPFVSDYLFQIRIIDLNRNALINEIFTDISFNYKVAYGSDKHVANPIFLNDHFLLYATDLIDNGKDKLEIVRLNLASSNFIKLQANNAAKNASKVVIKAGNQYFVNNINELEVYINIPEVSYQVITNQNSTDLRQPTSSTWQYDLKDFYQFQGFQVRVENGVFIGLDGQKLENNQLKQPEIIGGFNQVENNRELDEKMKAAYDIKQNSKYAYIVWDDYEIGLNLNVYYSGTWKYLFENEDNLLLLNSATTQVRISREGTPIILIPDVQTRYGEYLLVIDIKDIQYTVTIFNVDDEGKIKQLLQNSWDNEGVLNQWVTFEETDENTIYLYLHQGKSGTITSYLSVITNKVATDFKALNEITLDRNLKAIYMSNLHEQKNEVIVCTSQYINLYLYDEENHDLKFQATYDEPYKYYGDIKSCRATDNGGKLSVATAEGTFNYVLYQDWISGNYYLVQQPEWHRAADKSFDKQVEIVYNDDQAWVEISTFNSQYYLIRLFSLQYKAGENLMLSIVYHSKPKCSFEQGYQKIFMHCLENLEYHQYVLQTKYEIQYTNSELEYTYNADLKFCVLNTNSCYSTKLQTQAISKDKYLILKGRQDINGIWYDQPDSYIVNPGIGNETIYLWIPVSNYFSGHDLSYEIQANEHPVEVQVQTKVEESYENILTELKDSEDLEITTEVGMFEVELQLFGKSLYAFIIPGGILQKFYVYVDLEQNGKFTKVTEVKTDKKLGQADIFDISEKKVYFAQTDGKVYKQIEWIAYDITNPESPVQLQVSFDGKDVSQYANTQYKMEIYQNTIYSVTDQCVLVFDIIKLENNTLELKERQCIKSQQDSSSTLPQLDAQASWTYQDRFTDIKVSPNTDSGYEKVVIAETDLDFIETFSYGMTFFGRFGEIPATFQQGDYLNLVHVKGDLQCDLSIQLVFKNEGQDYTLSLLSYDQYSKLRKIDLKYNLQNADYGFAWSTYINDKKEMYLTLCVEDFKDENPTCQTLQLSTSSCPLSKSSHIWLGQSPKLDSDDYQYQIIDINVYINQKLDADELKNKLKSQVSCRKQNQNGKCVSPELNMLYYSLLDYKDLDGQNIPDRGFVEISAHDEKFKGELFNNLSYSGSMWFMNWGANYPDIKHWDSLYTIVENRYEDVNVQNRIPGILWKKHESQTEGEINPASVLSMQYWRQNAGHQAYTLDLKTKPDSRWMFLMWDICVEDKENTMRIYYRNWEDTEMKVLTVPFDETTFNPRTFIRRDSDIFFIGGGNPGNKDSLVNFGSQSSFNDVRFFPSGCLNKIQAEEIAMEAQKCHQSCPNSCLGPQQQHCTSNYIPYFQLTDKEYEVNLSPGNQIDLKTSFNGLTFNSDSYTLTFWAKYNKKFDI